MKSHAEVIFKNLHINLQIQKGMLSFVYKLEHNQKRVDDHMRYICTIDYSIDNSTRSDFKLHFELYQCSENNLIELFE